MQTTNLVLPADILTKSDLELFLKMTTKRYKVIEKKPGHVIIKIPLDRAFVIKDYLDRNRPTNLFMRFIPLRWYECRIFHYSYKTVKKAKIPSNGGSGKIEIKIRIEDESEKAIINTTTS